MEGSDDNGSRASHHQPRHNLSIHLVVPGYFFDSVDYSIYSAMTINFHIYVLQCNFSFTFLYVRCCPVLGLALATTVSQRRTLPSVTNTKLELIFCGHHLGV
jgi:hypothetical protein